MALLLPAPVEYQREDCAWHVAGLRFKSYILPPSIQSLSSRLPPRHGVRLMTVQRLADHAFNLR